MPAADFPVSPVTDFWSAHRSGLRDYIARRVRERENVDDILQETFIKVKAGLHTVKSEGSMTAWLYRVAANTIADHYRAQKHWEELPADDELPAPDEQPDLLAELSVCLLPFIAELPETYRVALQLSEVEGLPQKLVAQRLGLSLSGVKSRVQRGREKLRLRMLDCCDIEIGQGGISGYEQRERNSRVVCG